MLVFEEIICQLIVRHNCVIVPGFGGFVSKQVSAQLDLEKGSIRPPYKALLFNPQLLSDDGLLIAEHARLNGLYYQESKANLQVYVDDIQRRLHAGDLVQLPKLGTFKRMPNGQLNFEQDRFFNLLLSSYGLTELRFIPDVAQESAADETPIVTLPATKSPLWKVAAAACILPIAFYSFWIPTQTNVLQSGLFSYKDFNPFYAAKQKHYAKSKFRIAPLTTQASIGLSEQLGASEPGTLAFYEWNRNCVFRVQLPKAEVEPTASPAQVLTPTSGFEFVVGCFSNERNAQNLVAQLKRDGFAAHILPGGTLIRVSAGNALTETALDALRMAAQQRGLQGWIYKH